jgi:hypothetical protein
MCGPGSGCPSGWWTGYAIDFIPLGGGKRYVARAQSGGSYAITLPAGRYSVDTGGAHIVLLNGTFTGIVEGPREVAVVAGQTTAANLRVVSGSDRCT